MKESNRTETTKKGENKVTTKKPQMRKNKEGHTDRKER